MKSIEQQLAEALDLNKSQAAKITTLETQITEANKAQAAATLVSLLSEAKLPAPAAKELNNRFKDAVAITGMKEAVEAYAEVFKETVKKNNGANDNAAPNTESDAAGAKEKLAKSFLESGLAKTKEEADKMAAE